LEDRKGKKDGHTVMAGSPEYSTLMPLQKQPPVGMMATLL
jgi:hypothetical protein